MEKEILDNLTEENIDNRARLEILKDLKKKADNILNFIKQMEKLRGSTKESKQAKKTMEKFIKCNITNPAIYKRYQEVMILMEKYANGIKA